MVDSLQGSALASAGAVLCVVLMLLGLRGAPRTIRYGLGLGFGLLALSPLLLRLVFETVSAPHGDAPLYLLLLCGALLLCGLIAVFRWHDGRAS
ncbi:MAG TPA: hypothetical protein VE268_06185 [Herpetosiphonaceae bacterium]|jgi:hypothetical protein|nr:hypothetical protein [Herpetosiphonaceae bacterium]